MSSAFDRARAIVRDAGGAELTERLNHLDATRAAPPPDAALARPDRGAHVDADVLVAGGGLSLLLAPALADLGLRVVVADRGRAGVAHREWNASRAELSALARAGIFTEAEIDALVVARYREGVCRWHRGGAWPVRGVLDHAVDARRLLEATRARAEERGVIVRDHRALVGVGDGPGGVVARLRGPAGETEEIVARVLVDARGAASPHARADLVCPTVGGVLTGLARGTAPDEVDPEVGDVLVTTEDAEDGRQHVWEGFPGEAGSLTTYLFYYARSRDVPRGALLALYARFFETLPRYKRGVARLARPTFGYIPGWSRLGPAPRAPSPRIVLVGDAAARHSPLTFCGFGATLRSLARTPREIAARVAAPAARAPSVVDDAPVHAGTGALAAMMAVLPSCAPAGELNELLDAAFGTLHGMSDDAYGALLRDELPMPRFVEFLRRTARRHPRVYEDAARALGPGGLTRWGLGVALGSARAGWRA